MNWYFKTLNQYADFNGRARRTEYWMFVLFNMLFAILALILDNVLDLTIAGLPYGVLYILYSLAVFIPGLAVTVRRLQDTNQSGYMIFISLIPIIGSIWLLVLLLKESDHHENDYGVSPKLIENGQVGTVVNSSDTIILAIVIWMILSRVFWITMPLIFESYYNEIWFQPVSIVLNLIWSVIPLALAFAVKDKSKQIILFVLGVIYIVIAIVETINRIFQPSILQF